MILYCYKINADAVAQKYNNVGNYPWTDSTEMKMNICILQPDNQINSRVNSKKHKSPLTHSYTHRERRERKR